ncbi:MAG: TRAP transporter substrate-binding protein [Gammaproteobacteria bacterium]|nr:TRAP transporter substrate-binding protein [Gammaproteobacteria bacterium]
MSHVAARVSATLIVCASLSATHIVLAQETIRIAGNFVPSHSSSIAIDQFEQDVELATEGQLDVQVFNNMQLGGAQENVSQVRAGTIMMTWVGMAYLTRTVPELEAVSVPFLFPSREVAYQVMDGPIGELFAEKLAEKGFELLGIMELGERQVTNNVRPIRKLADLQGLKIRLQPNETHLDTFRALGANPIAMDVREVYSALQQDVIDGQENPYNVILASRYPEVQKFLSNTGHFFDFIPVVANKKKFAALSPVLQEAIKTAMRNAVLAQRKAAAKADAQALAELQKQGMQYDALAPSEREAMRAAAADIVDEIRGRVGGDLLDRVIEKVQQAAGS